MNNICTNDTKYEKKRSAAKRSVIKCAAVKNSGERRLITGLLAVILVFAIVPFAPVAHLGETTAAAVTTTGQTGIASVNQVNVHMGETADRVYLTYTAAQDGYNTVTVGAKDGNSGSAVFTATAEYSDTAKKFIYKAVIDNLSADSVYIYDIGFGAYKGEFSTAGTSGAFTFAYITDTQIAFAADAKAVGAGFNQLNTISRSLKDEQGGLAFAFIAGDMVDSPRNEYQWEMLFKNSGEYSESGQAFFGNHLIAAAKGNHDNSTFTGHISAPSASADVGAVCYSFDYSNMKMVVLNLGNADTYAAQAEFLRAEGEKAKAAGQWLVVGTHQSIYTGAAHIIDDVIVAARKFWSPIFAEVGVDAVLQGHDHVYSRGFVTSAGANANLQITQNAYEKRDGAPLYVTGGQFGAAKWYNSRSYKVKSGDLLATNYSFLDINSGAPAQNPWGGNTGVTKEQTYTLITVDGYSMTFRTYMYKYDSSKNKMVIEPYLYDTISLKRENVKKNIWNARQDIYAAAY